MPEPRLERALRRMLPADVRERVFDPALGDARHARTRSGDRVAPWWLVVVTTFGGCVVPAVRTAVVRKGRLTRLGRGLVWACAIGGLAVTLISGARRAYAGY